MFIRASLTDREFHLTEADVLEAVGVNEGLSAVRVPRAGGGEDIRFAYSQTFYYEEKQADYLGHHMVDREVSRSLNDAQIKERLRRYLEKWRVRAPSFEPGEGEFMVVARCPH